MAGRSPSSPNKGNQKMLLTVNLPNAPTSTKKFYLTFNLECLDGIKPCLMGGPVDLDSETNHAEEMLADVYDGDTEGFTVVSLEGELSSKPFPLVRTIAVEIEEKDAKALALALSTTADLIEIDSKWLNGSVESHWRKDDTLRQKVLAITTDASRRGFTALCESVLASPQAR